LTDCSSVCAQLSGSASLFELHRIPLLYVYSDADKFIDLHLNAEFAAMFSAGDPFLLPTDIYNAQCQPTALRQKSGNSLIQFMT